MVDVVKDPLETNETMPDVEMATVLRLSGRAMGYMPVYGLIALVFGVMPSALVVSAFPVNWEPLPAYQSYYGVVTENWGQLSFLVVELFALLACAGVTAAALQWRRANDVSIIQNMLEALKRWPLIVLNALVINLAIFGLWGVMRWSQNIWLFMILNIACIVFMCMLAAAFILFIPVIIEERGGLFMGLTRSRFLTRGYAGQAFLLTLVCGGATGAICWLPLLVDSVADTLYFAYYSVAEIPLFVLWVRVYAQALWRNWVYWNVSWLSFGAIFWMVSITMLYCRLREIKEGWRPRS